MPRVLLLVQGGPPSVAHVVGTCGRPEFVVQCFSHWAAKVGLTIFHAPCLYFKVHLYGHLGKQRGFWHTISKQFLKVWCDG